MLSLWSQVPFCIDGPNGVLKHLEYLLETKGHVVMCVAEGAGQVHRPPRPSSIEPLFCRRFSTHVRGDWLHGPTAAPHLW